MPSLTNDQTTNAPMTHSPMTIHQHPLIRYFAAITPLTSEEAEAIYHSMVLRTYPKDHTLLRAGDVAVESYFVLKGCIRQYSMLDGVEKINAFFTENDWVLSLNSLDAPSYAPHYWTCCEETTLVLGNDNGANALFAQFPKFEMIARKILENTLFQQQHTMARYSTESPEERYQNLLSARPDLFQRLPQYQIASYIGVQPESLSRIRKRLHERKNVR